MTVHELSEMLKNFDPHMSVLFVDVVSDVQGVASYSIDKVEAKNNFVQLISVD